MTKRRTLGKQSHQSAKSRSGESDHRDTKGDEAARHYVPSSSAVRETIESVVVAFVLAFLFRTFEAEAFVIPTGSMAPTLMGRHKDLECPICGFEYQASASDEVNQLTNALTGNWVEQSTCPMCRYTYHPGKAAVDANVYPPFWDEYPSYKGDRILVGKFCYQFSDPERWDVVVFKFPGGAQYNYIKRLVGLPGETVHIEHGDVFVRPDGGDFAIARKQRPEKLLAVLQPVYDNDYVVPRIVESGDWPARWQSWPSDDGDGQGTWTTSEDLRSFQTDGRAPDERWLRYQHIVPIYWRTSDDGQPIPVGFDRPQLISDFTAYNTSRAAGKEAEIDCDAPGMHWVGDLAVRCTMDVVSGSGEALFELVEGGWRMQCRIDVATGVATLAIDDETASGPVLTEDGREYRPTAQTTVRGPGQHEVLFANCDDQLRLLVDGTAVEFDTTTCYAPLDNWHPRDGRTISDLRPVSIGSQGASLKVSHLKVLRDIYYIAEKEPRLNNLLTDYENPFAAFGAADYQELTPEAIAEVFSDPGRWGAFDRMRHVDFSLEADQFFMLGDNSAKSRDSRLWGRDGVESYVRRDLLIGKALYIYWPHSWHRIPGTDIPFPLFPNFARMGFVR